MRVLGPSLTLSVAACLLCLLTQPRPVLLTHARALRSDPAPRPDQRPSKREGPDTAHTAVKPPTDPVARAASLVSIRSDTGVPRTPHHEDHNGTAGERHSLQDENWRQKTLGDDGAVIPNSTQSTQSDTGKSRFGTGNPRREVNSSIGAPALDTMEGGSAAVSSPGTDTQTRSASSVGVQTPDVTEPGAQVAPSLAPPSGNTHSHSMMGDDPRIVSEPSNQSTSSNSSSGTESINTVFPPPSKVFYRDDIQLGCRELRARRYITDGFCTSETPIKEVVCAGNCLPIRDMPWYAEFIKTMSRNKLREYHCVEDYTRLKKVTLLCKDGTVKTYRIKVVKSCRCERVGSRRNRTSPDRGRRKGRRRKRKGKNGDRDKKKRRRERRRRRRKNKKTGVVRERERGRNAERNNDASNSEKKRSISKTRSGS